MIYTKDSFHNNFKRQFFIQNTKHLQLYFAALAYMHYWTKYKFGFSYMLKRLRILNKNKSISASQASQTKDSALSRLIFDSILEKPKTMRKKQLN